MAIKRWFKRTVIALVVVAGVATTFAYWNTVRPGPLTEPKNVVIQRGRKFLNIAEQLKTEGVVHNPYVFAVATFLTGRAQTLKAGEYAFTPGISTYGVMQMMQKGEVVVHKITIPEGITVRQVLEILQKEQGLSGDITMEIPEGSILPETYQYLYGDTRMEMITRMQTGMSNTLAELWPKRKQSLPIATPEEAVILASIVEKETGIDEERGRVASVFVNRLRKSIRLQSDPTIMYGIEKETGKPFTRAIVMSDITRPTPYNTYTIDRLPPTPICNPGRKSLEAVLNPPETNDLYFVATGNGGHNFAATLKEHNDNVAAYRAARAEKKALSDTAP